jgi:RNA polymerase sigma factor (sigma-70 family)
MQATCTSTCAMPPFDLRKRSMRIPKKTNSSSSGHPIAEFAGCGATALKHGDDTKTSRTLLGQVSDWGDDGAWARFREKYDPLLRRWCRGHGLDDDSIDEVCQRVWIELADRMKSFQYDPNRTFRGWLRRLCESRIVDFLRQRKASRPLSLDRRDVDPDDYLGRAAIDATSDNQRGSEADPFRLSLLEEAEKVQALVRAKVKPHTWDAFWLVVVCDWSVTRTAKSLGMTHTAVYGARERVARMLCDEGKRLLNCCAGNS